MKEKIKTTLLIAIFILSTIAITTVLAAYEMPEKGYQLVSDDGYASWENPDSDITRGPYSAKFSTSIENYVYVWPDTDITLGTFAYDDVSFDYWSLTGDAPELELRFISPNNIDPSGAGHLDITILSGQKGTQDGTTNWYTLDELDGTETGVTYGNYPPSHAKEGFGIGPDDNAWSDQYTELSGTFADMIAFMTGDAAAPFDASDWVLYRVAPQDWGHAFDNVYIDNVRVGTNTYDIEPIVLDAEYYETGETVTVTLLDNARNVDEDVREILWPINVVSETMSPDGIDISLMETGLDTGIFTGTFKLVDVTPGTGELLVADGNTIDIDSFEELATIDNTIPVVEITAPEDEAFVKGDVTFAATIVEDNEDTTVLKINGEEMTGGLAYAWDTDDGYDLTPPVPVWPDGSYTIEVIVTDLIGNIGSDLITVTVDNTDPEIANELVSPSTVYPDTAATFAFTAEVSDAGSVDTVKINLYSIGGGSAVSMLDDGVDPDVTADDGVYTTSYESTDLGAASYEVSITATDEAGNTMEADLTIVSSTDLVKPVISDETITYPIGVVSARLGDSVVISATAIDAEGIESVTVSDDPDLDILTDVAMLDPDEDDTYSLTIDSLETFVPGSYVLTITATDINANTETATVTLDVTTKLTGYNLDLEEGWNLFSLPLIPDDSSVEIVLADIMENVDIVWGYKDDAWSRYLPAVPEFSTLTDMVDGDGYWVKMTEADTLAVSGVELPEPPELPPVYPVYAGWNLIGFKEVESMTGGAYFATIPELVRASSVCYGWDATVQAYEMAYLAGTQSIPFDPGQGYWLYLTEDANIVP